MRKRRGYAAIEYMLMFAVILTLIVAVYSGATKQLEKTTITVPIYVLSPHLNGDQVDNSSYEYFDLSFSLTGNSVTITITPKKDMSKIQIVLQGTNTTYGSHTWENIPAGESVSYTFNNINPNDPALVLEVVLIRAPPKWL